MDEAKKNWKVPDWSREAPQRFWDPGKKLLLSIRDYQKSTGKSPFSLMRKKICVLRHRFWSVVCSSEIDLNCQIGGGLLLPHPYGIVIHPKAVIGENCLIFQNVTLAGEVELKHHVDVGAGAFLRGPITVNANVKIGANAVLTTDAEPNSVYIGVPAKRLIKD
ncbi:MAG: serine acetyltransferase [Blastomonas sp.]|nr:serine acetyltransferase [Blastomonas sp.]|tara:strand:- start:2532 stop:3020 length:489 start_codon:yes stop_codon:yes gene_type:complete